MRPPARDRTGSQVPAVTCADASARDPTAVVTMRCRADLHDACTGCPCPCHDNQQPLPLPEVTP